MSLRSGAAVDDEPGPGHETSIVGGEKNDALGDVGNRAQATDRESLERLPAGRVDIVRAELLRPACEDLSTHIGLDQAGMDRVDADLVALARKFERRRFREERD